jgi:hypothetical protein
VKAAEDGMLLRYDGQKFAVLLYLVDNDLTHDPEGLEGLGIGNGEDQPLACALTLEYPFAAHESCLLGEGNLVQSGCHEELLVRNMLVPDRFQYEKPFGIPEGLAGFGLDPSEFIKFQFGHQFALPKR